MELYKLPEYLASHPSVFMGNPPVTSLQSELPFSELTWQNFERLCLRLARGQASVKECRLYGESGDKQEGIDLYATKGESTEYTVYQCKREKDFGPQKVAEAVTTFLQGEWKDKTNEFVLCVKESLKSKKRTDEVILQRGILKAQGIDLTIWDSDELNLILKEKPLEVYEFFGMEWCKAFCGAEKAATITPVPEPPPRRIYSEVPGYIERFAIVSDRDSVSAYIDQGESLFELIKKHDRIALVGQANDGKSTALQHLAHQLSAAGVYYPYLVQLKNYTSESIESHIPELSLLRSEQVVLLLDGLDEVITDDFEVVVRKIRQFSEDNPQVRIVVSCRRNLYIVDSQQHQDTLTKFTPYKLRVLTQLQVNNYLKKLQVDKGLKVEEFLKSVREKRYSDLIFVPYFLIQLSDQFIKEGTIANSIAEISFRFIDQLISKDVTRHYPHDRTNKRKLLLQLLTKLAFTLEYSGKNVCKLTDLDEIFDSSEIRLLKAAGSVLQATEDQDANWSFLSNNFQEVLAAMLLQGQSVDKVLSIICFPPKYLKVKPTWTNTVSLLLSLFDQHKKSSILNKLTPDNDELVIRFEPNNVHEDVRFDIFKRIFSHYALQGKRINESKYSTRDLAQFGKCEMTFKYLLDCIGPEARAFERINSLIILGKYDWEADATQYATELKSRLEAMLFEKPESPYLTILAYCSLFKLSTEEFTRLFDEFFDSKDTWTLTALYSSILKQKYQEQFLDRILTRSLEFIRSEHEEREGRLGDEYLLLNECLTNLTSADSLLKLLDFLSHHFDEVLHSIHFAEVIDFALKSSLSFNRNPKFYEKIRDMFLDWDMNFADDRRDKFIQYFDRSGTRTQFFKDTYQKRQPLESITILLLAKLSNKESLDFLTKEYSNGKISKDEIVLFQNYLGSYAPDFLKDFNDSLNKIDVIPLPVYRDYNTEKKNQNALTVEVLFSKERFIEKIQLLFVDIDKPEITFDDIWHYIADDHNQHYPPVLMDIIRSRTRSDVLNAKDLVDRLNKKWDLFQIEELYRFLKDHPDFALQEDQVAYLKKWCESVLQTFDFRTATVKEGDRYTTKWNAIYLSFFIRHFKFRDLGTNVYLDMLSFHKWDDNGPEINDFVKDVLPVGEIKQRIIDNLKNQSVHGQAFLNHINFCKDERLDIAAPHLLPYIQSPDTYHRHATLETYSALDGSMVPLEQLLPTITDSFRFEIIRSLIAKKSPTIERFVVKEFKKASTTEEKLSYAFLLIRMQNATGIDFVLKYTESNKDFPTPAESPFSPYLDHLTNLKFLRPMFRLYRLGQDPATKFDHFSDPRSYAASAIHSICLFGNNFKKARRIYRNYKRIMSFRNWFKEDKRISELTRDLDYQFEIIESKYYANLGASITIKEAKSMYKSLAKASFN